MGKTQPGTVRDTGAGAGEILIGVGPSNRQLRIRVHRAQKKGIGGRPNGSFELLDAGTGPYSRFLSEFVGQDFLDARDLFGQVGSKPGAEKCTNIINMNLMKVWREPYDAAG